MAFSPDSLLFDTNRHINALREVVLISGHVMAIQ